MEVGMKKEFFIIIGSLLMSFGAWAQKPKKVAAPVSKAVTYSLDTKQSLLTWNGKKVTGEHTGNLMLKSGSLVIEGSHLTGGEFVIDMTSLTCTDLKDAEWNKKLVDHLKNDDFFSVDKHGTASLKIKNVIFGKGGIYNVTADLTIKGITKPILFDAEVDEVKGGAVKARAVIVFNRTDYDVKYNSGKFFQNLGDKLISDDVSVSVSLVTQKK
jgi:polyisoprenoid-binding protein YceI